MKNNSCAENRLLAVVEEKLAGTEHTFTLRQVRSSSQDAQQQHTRRMLSSYRRNQQPWLSVTPRNLSSSLRLRATFRGINNQPKKQVSALPQLNTLATDALESWDQNTPTICDPSCGGGALLLSLNRCTHTMAQWICHKTSLGVDLNPIAVEITRWVLYLCDPQATPKPLVLKSAMGMPCSALISVTHLLHSPHISRAP